MALNWREDVQVEPLYQGWLFSLLPDLSQWLQFSVQLIFLHGSLEKTGYNLRRKGIYTINYGTNIITYINAGMA
jgi:hypothetical protein